MRKATRFSQAGRKTLGGLWAIGAALATGPAVAADDDKPTVKLEEIVVTADRDKSFGTDYIQAGTFRNARQIDTPLTVTVISESMLKAQQASGILDALRNSAGVTSSQINTSVYSNLAIRGIIVENRGNFRLNGTLPIINLIDMPLENKIRVEALKGASALYYGFTTPAGIINLTSKRPTSEPYFGAKIAGNNHRQVVGSVDASNTWGTFGARINGAIGSQDTGVNKVDGDREFVSAAFDWKPIRGLMLQLDAEYITKAITEPTIISLASTGPFAFILPPLQDPKVNLGADWLKSDSREQNLLAHGQYNFTDSLALSVDVGQSALDRYRRFSTFINYNLTTGAGTVNVDPLNRISYRNNMSRIELVGKFATGALIHEPVLGYSRNVRKILTPNRVALNFAQNYYNPVDLPAEVPFLPRVVPNPSTIDDKGLYIFDRIQYDTWLQVLAGLRRSDYVESSLTGGVTYKDKPNSPSVGVVVKPMKWISLYGTYIEGLETGGTAPAGSTNQGEVLPAGTSKQYEAGIKMEPIKGFLLTLGYFDIDRASAFVDPVSRRFVQDGRATYKGFELSATGELTPDLSIFVSAMSLDAKQGLAANAALIGKRIENTPKTTLSAFAEYRLPAVPGLAVSAGVFYTGDRAVNALNQAFVPGFTTVNLGASYTTQIKRAETSFRLSWENVGEKRYWAATGSGFLAPGLPSLVKFSVETVF